MGKHDFMRLRFKMSFGWISYIAQPPWVLIMSPVLCKAITRANAYLLSFGISYTNFSRIQIKRNQYSFNIVHLKCCLLNASYFCSGFNVANSPLNLILSCCVSSIAIYEISLINFNSNIAKSHLSITSSSVAQSFWNFAQSTAVSQPCSVQNVKTIGEVRY